MTFKKRYTVPIIIVLALIGLRIALPFIVTDYVNKTLQNIEGYTGSIEDIDIHLYRGAYKICGLNIQKSEGDLDVPFITSETIDLSVEWKSLFDGAIVGEVEMQQPKVHFVFANTAAATQNGTETDWTQVVKDLMPISINRFAVKNGDMVLGYYLDTTELRSTFQDIDIELTNIRNVEDRSVDLPSDIVAAGYSPTYNGQLDFQGKAMLLKEVPNIDYNAKFTEVQLKSINPIMKGLTDMDFEEGKIDLFSEMAIKDGQMKGYFKPIIHDAKIFKWKETDRTFFEGVKEFFAEGVQEIFENNSKEKTATIIEVKGPIENYQTATWSAIIIALKNAFWDSLKAKLDDSVEYKDLADSNISIKGDLDNDGKLSRKERKKLKKSENN